MKSPKFGKVFNVLVFLLFCFTSAFAIPKVVVSTDVGWVKTATEQNQDFQVQSVVETTYAHPIVQDINLKVPATTTFRLCREMNFLQIDADKQYAKINKSAWRTIQSKRIVFARNKLIAE